MLPLDDAQIKFVCKSFDLYWNFHENEEALSDSGKWIRENMFVVVVFPAKKFNIFWYSDAV